MMRRLLSLILFSLLTASVSLAQSGPTELYRSVQKSYAQQKYDQAEKSLNELVDRIGGKGETAGLLYAFGNLYFQKGQNGLAIQYYEKAKRLAPRNWAIRHNLSLAQKRLGLADEEDMSEYLLKTAYFWNFWLSRDELMVAFAVLSVFFWSVLLCKLLRSKKLMTLNVGLTTLVYLYFAFGLSLKYDTEKPGRHAIVILPQASIKANFLKEAEETFKLGEGRKVRIEDEQDLGREGRWFRVSLPDGAMGWVSSDAIGLI